MTHFSAMTHLSDIADRDEFDSNSHDSAKEQPFNVEAEEIDEDIENVIKGDAIGNTLYSKSWLLNFFLSLANSRRVEEFDRHFETVEQNDGRATGDPDSSDPESILSNFDSLVAMSAEESVAQYLIDVNSGCLGMLVAEILPVQVNEEHTYFVAIRSHFWRRQELCLVTLSNIVVHHEVLKRMLEDISNATEEVDHQNILSQLVQLSFSCVLFGENFALQAEFTSVLVACFQFLRNLTYSLNMLLCENQESSSVTTDDVEENIEASSLVDAVTDSNVSTRKYSPSEKVSEGNCNDTENIQSNSSSGLRKENKDMGINVPLKSITDEILTIVSKPEVVQVFGVILASSCNEELLNKMSRLLTVLIELSSDLESESLVNAYGHLPFLYCLKEALKQTYMGSHDMKTTFIYIDFMGEIFNQLNICETQKVKALFLDDNGQKDEQFPIEVCDTLANIANEIDDLQNGAIITKVLRVLWQQSVSSKHSKSFENVGKLLMNSKKQIPNWNALELEDQVAYSSIIDGLSIFIQSYGLCDESDEHVQSNEMCIAKFVQQEHECHHQILGNEQSAFT